MWIRTELAWRKLWPDKGDQIRGETQTGESEAESQTMHPCTLQDGMFLTFKTYQAHMLLHGEGGASKSNPQENQQFPWGSRTEVGIALHPRDGAVPLHGAVRTRNAISFCLVLMVDMGGEWGGVVFSVQTVSVPGIVIVPFT